MQPLRMVLIWASTLFSVACLQGGPIGATDATVEVEAIYHATQCPSTPIEPHGSWIDSPVGLGQLWNHLHRLSLGGRSLASPEVDFSVDGLLLVHMGQQRTGGYAIELADPIAQVKDGIASVLVDWITPLPDTVVTQMITAPCILLKLQKSDFSSIQVIDQDGRVRVVVDVR
jgi:hypothetical protein